MSEPTYPVGLTVREIEQRAWVEGDLRTAALLRLRPDDHRVDDRANLSQELGKIGQLPLKLEKS